MVAVSRSSVLERRLVLARSLHRKRPSTQQCALDLRVAIDACRSSLLALDPKVAMLGNASGQLRELHDRLRACSTRLDHALVEVAACLPRDGYR
jgi:hypothetical protein